MIIIEIPFLISLKIATKEGKQISLKIIGNESFPHHRQIMSGVQKALELSVI